MTPPVIAVVGLSDSGKTRVATALIQKLAAQGYRIAAVKHSPHGHQVDRPGSDSARLFEAGAAKTVISSPRQMTTIQRTEGDMALEEIVASLDPAYDLVVAEGFKAATVPKVLVHGKEEISPEPQNLIAVVSDGTRVRDVDLPHYSFGELDQLVRQVREELLDGSPRGPGVSLVVDGVPIPLKPFPSRTLAELIHGFIRALDDIPSSPQRISLSLVTPEGGDTPTRSH